MSDQFEVDVYLPFVDGNDESYVRKMQACATELNDFSEQTSGFQRVNNFGQLRLAVRSIAHCLPWIRTLHLIFHDESQIPVWLDRNHPKIKAHCHRDYFDAAISLPTFSSFVIDTQIGRVPGLSEHFIYIEDDQFFCREISQSELFNEDGLPIFEYHIRPNGMTAWNDLNHFDSQARAIWPNSYKFANYLWRDAFGINNDVELTIIDDHRPYPFLKSIFEQANSRFDVRYELSVQQRFRRSNVLSLYTYLWGMVWNQQVINCSDWQLMRFNFPGKILKASHFGNFSSACINDNTCYEDEETRLDHTARVTAYVEGFTQLLFPQISDVEMVDK